MLVMKTPLAFLTDSPLKSIFDKVGHLTRLNQSWIHFARKEWTDTCRVANYEEGVLTLTVPNSSWATRIHYTAPEIIKDLRLCDVFNNIRKIRCRIVHPTPNPIKTVPHHRSDTTGRLLLETADKLKVSQLKDSLLRLASRFIDG
jgi:hypothetical protein